MGRKILPLFAALSLLGSCELLLGQFGPERCQEGEEAACIEVDGVSTLRSCDIDGFVQFSQCDLGCIIAPGPDSCDVCGNEISLVAESCDDGQQCDDNSPCTSSDECADRGAGVCAPRDGDDCPADCILPTCGDGILEANKGEVCDEGDILAGDGCRADCLGIEDCGDGLLDEAKEEKCDDGNTTDGDGCKGDCLAIEFCGDSIQQNNLGEACDDGNTTDGDNCSADCRSDEQCGNGIVDSIKGEACDDGNTANGDGCNSACALENCGDGQVGAGETCDDGNNTNGDGCENNCTLTCDLLQGNTDPISGHCYLAIGAATNWNQAQTSCAAIPVATGINPHLATITSLQENTFVRLLNVNIDFWIGLTDQTDNNIGSSENIFRWITKERPSSFVNFAPGQPDDSFGEDCVQFFGGSLHWNDAKCTDNHAYVCEIDFDKTCGNNILEEGEVCDDGNKADGDGCNATCDAFSCADEAGAQPSRTLGFSDSCYVLFDGASAKIWTEAATDCRARGGHFATVRNGSSGGTEQEIIRQLNVLTGQFVWIGFSDINSEGLFQWENGEPTTFTRFASGEPNNFGGNEDCVSLTGNTDWNDDLCDKTLAYICEF